MYKKCISYEQSPFPNSLEQLDYIESLLHACTAIAGQLLHIYNAIV